MLIAHSCVEYHDLLLPEVRLSEICPPWVVITKECAISITRAILYQTSRDIARNNALIRCQNRRVVTSSHVESRRLRIIMAT